MTGRNVIWILCAGLNLVTMLVRIVLGDYMEAFTRFTLAVLSLYIAWLIHENDDLRAKVRLARDPFTNWMRR